MSLLTAPYLETFAAVRAQVTDISTFHRPPLREALNTLVCQAQSSGWQARAIVVAYCAVVALVRFCSRITYRALTVRGAPRPVC